MNIDYLPKATQKKLRQSTLVERLEDEFEDYDPVLALAKIAMNDRTIENKEGFIVPEVTASEKIMANKVVAEYVYAKNRASNGSTDSLNTIKVIVEENEFAGMNPLEMADREIDYIEPLLVDESVEVEAEVVSEQVMLNPFSR